MRLVHCVSPKPWSPEHRLDVATIVRNRAKSWDPVNRKITVNILVTTLGERWVQAGGKVCGLVEPESKGMFVDISFDPSNVVLSPDKILLEIAEPPVSDGESIVEIPWRWASDITICDKEDLLMVGLSAEDHWAIRSLFSIAQDEKINDAARSVIYETLKLLKDRCGEYIKGYVPKYRIDLCDYLWQECHKLPVPLARNFYEATDHLMIVAEEKPGTTIVRSYIGWLIQHFE